MLNLIHADLFKMAKSRAVKVSLFITTMCAIFIIIISKLIANGTLHQKVSGNAMMLSDIMVMSTIGAVIAGVFICSDFENKTINAAISCGHSRWKILVSKSIVYFLAMAIMLLPYCISTGIAFISGTKFGLVVIPSTFIDIIYNKSELVASGDVILKMMIIMLTVTIVYAGRLSICILLAFLIKKPVFVVGLGFGLALVFDMLVIMKDNLGMFGKVMEYTPFAMVYPVITMDAGAGTILKAIACSLVFIIVILLSTYSIFRKVEIK